jgi:hypothetical protein
MATPRCPAKLLTVSYVTDNLVGRQNGAHLGFGIEQPLRPQCGIDIAAIDRAERCGVRGLWIRLESDEFGNVRFTCTPQRYGAGGPRETHGYVLRLGLA